MTLASPSSPIAPVLLDARDQAQARALSRMKLLATLVLCASVAVMVVARVLQKTHADFAYLAAFAEAATIGGIADWYAVVVLFRRPLGLPIPHTAIIPQNQGRIADKLGTFIETKFLAPGPVAAKLREVDFARFAADWLSDPGRAQNLSRYLLRLLPDALSAFEQSGLRTTATRRLLAQFDALDVAPFASGVLKGLVADGRHQRILDDLLVSVSQLIDQPQTRAALGAKIRAELPSLLALSRADTYLLKRLVASISEFLNEVRADDHHPFRADFDRFVIDFVDRFAASPDYTARLADLKHALLLRPELGGLVAQAWEMLREAVDGAARGENTTLGTHLQRILSQMGRHLAEDADMRAEINGGMVVVLSSFIESQKSGVSRFIADQVKGWDIDQLVTLLEINVGADLQYIRFNGALIGGIAGLLLYALRRAFGLA